MRPTRLELEGFGSFRDHTEVDFGDADLFVLSGRTGSGKSTIIDALTFALYGVVARYDDRRLVEPVISKGRNEARVRLDFRIDGVMWSAVRVVRRVGDSGATTKEARLERWRDASGSDTEVVADGAGELNQRVERLLGLSYDHFTTCVVLPQGAFQEFLHAKPKARRDLLVDLLDLSVYAKVGQAARTAVKEAETRVSTLRTQLDGELAEATPEELEARRRRIGPLEELRATVAERQPVLDELLAEGTRQATHEKSLRAQRELLDGVTVPDDVVRLADELAAAETATTEADQALTTAGEAVEAAQTAQAEAGDAQPLTESRDLLARRTDLQEQLATAGQAVDDAGAVVDRAATHLDTLVAAATDAERDLEHARRHDLVAAVIAGLVPGDACPVCDTELTTLPEAADDSLDTARRARDAAVATRDAARSSLDQARASLSRAEARQQAVAEQLADATSRLEALAAAGTPTDVDTVAAALARLATLAEAVTERRRAESAARAARAEADKRAERARAGVRVAWEQFDRVRDGLAALSPPPRADDLAGSWEALATWAALRGPELRTEADAAATEVQRTREAYASARNELLGACRAVDVEPADGESPIEAAVRALERARTDVERLEVAVARATDVRKQVAEANERRQVSHALGAHLKSDRFQEWLVRRALAHLVHAATADLRAMSDGAYSLVLDDGGDFAVVDHRNADQVRPARTLSGGETFLASLALALALSQRVAEMAAQGAARLEALFLDEGFGTLDADTLSTVADALEELGSRGRMVGVITHVPELAARLPVRFDVTKVGPSSTISRAGDGVDAVPPADDA